MTENLPALPEIPGASALDLASLQSLAAPTDPRNVFTMTREQAATLTTVIKQADDWRSYWLWVAREYEAWRALGFQSWGTTSKPSTA